MTQRHYALCWALDIRVIICLTKADLVNRKTVDIRIQELSDMIKTLPSSKRTGDIEVID
jgi:GTPase